MKRFYLPAFIAAIGASALTFGLFAESSIAWQRLDAQEKAQTQGRRQVNPKQRAAERAGIINPNAQLVPVTEGYFATPVISQRPANVIAKSLENPRGNVFGIVPRHSGLNETGDNAFLARIDCSNLTISPVYYGTEYLGGAGDAYVYTGGAVRDGKLYLPQTSYAIGYGGTVWNVVDLNDGNLSDIIKINAISYADPYSMTYDPEKDLFYTLGMDDETDSQLCIVDPNNGFSVKHVGHLGRGTYVAAIVYNPMDKETYVFDADNTIYIVDPETASLTIAGSLDLDYEIFTPQASGAICYSPMDQQFVAIFRDNTSGVNRLFMISPETWEAFQLGELGGRSDSFIASLICSDEFAVADAPELPGEIKLEFANAATSGNISFTVPTMTYYGVQIPASQNIQVTLKTGNTIVYSATHHAGDKVDGTYTLPTGLNNLSLTCAIGENVSPARKYTVWIGYDHPNAPTDLYFEQNLLTWSAPGNVGAHDGYVDTSDLTYNVYLDGVKLNSTPLTDTKFTVTPPEEFKASDFTVIAVSRDLESPAAKLHATVGKAYTLPFGMMPTQSESKLFTAENSNRDSASWNYATQASDPSKGGLLLQLNQYNDNDDWIFLPLINFPTVDNMYQLQFYMASSFASGTTQSLDIAIGTHPSAAGMKNVVYTNNSYPLTAEGEVLSVRFAVSNPGDYYIGIHDRSEKTKGAKGMFINDFKVTALSGSSSAVPANPTTVEITAAPLGANRGIINLTLPVNDVTGRPLPANDQITATVSCDRYSDTATGTPGQKVTVEVPTPTFGMQNFDIILSNSNGSGMRSTHNAYIGIDRPLAPTNIARVVADDNRSMRLTWDAPESTGVNGGYVDVENLTYEIYLRSGVNYTRIGSTKGNYINYETTVDNQSTHIVGPAAVNEAGISQYSLFIQETLGKPYEMPMVEEFNTTVFSYSPYSFAADNEYKGSRWENEKNPANFGIGDITGHVQGVIAGYSESGAAVPCKLFFPKATTKGFNEGHFKIRVWDYTYAPNIDIYARTSSYQEEVRVGSIQMRRPSAGMWRDADIRLSEDILNQGWVQFAVRAQLNGNAAQYVIIDSWQLVGNTEYDFKMNEISGPEQVSVGDQATFNFAVANAGQLRNSGKLKVRLEQASGNVVSEQTFDVPNVNPNNVFEKNVTFDIDGTFADREQFVVRAIVEADKDEIEINNERYKVVNVKNSQLPTVSLLRATQNEETGEVSLGWFAPTATYGNFQDFELETPFESVDNFGNWTNVDFDGFDPAHITSGSLELKWPGSNKPAAWTVIDPSQLDFEVDERMLPHSGKQYIMARSVISEQEGNPYQASDWLISPEVKGGTEVSFWYNSLASDFSEYVYLWYSNSGNQLDPATATSTVNGDFIRLRPFSKVGIDSWEYCTYILPADAKYFALVYSSFDSLAAMIDDISFTPAQMSKWDIDHYSIYRELNGGKPECLVANTTDRRFTDTTIKKGDNALYYVYTHVKLGDKELTGPRSNMAKIGNPNVGVGMVTTLTGIYGGYGEILVKGQTGNQLSVYTPDGKLVKKTTALSDNEVISAEKGIYLVSNGSAIGKVVVK